MINHVYARKGADIWLMPIKDFVEVCRNFIETKKLHIPDALLVGEIKNPPMDSMLAALDNWDDYEFTRIVQTYDNTGQWP
jgi:hypothetical protein